MTSKEFREARLKLGLTLAALGKIIDTHPRTIRKWEADDDTNSARKPNPIACRVLQWLESGELDLSGTAR